MNQITYQQQQQVKLRIHLAGVIAYVREGNTIWTLLPNALAPTRAYWKPMPGLLDARSPHMALLIVDDGIFDRYESTGRAFAVYKPDHPRVIRQGSLYPITPGTKAATDLTGLEIDFSPPPGQGVTVDGEVDFVPQMKEISSANRFVSTSYRPGSGNFDPRKLSAAFQMTTGELKVGGYFGKPNLPPPKLDFGYVISFFGHPFYINKVWHKKVANHLIWTLTYPANQTYIRIKGKDWRYKNDYEYALRVPETKEIDIAVLHSEPEMPFLFAGDPKIPEEVSRFPDPDFEILYAISTAQSSLRRVPVPLEGFPGATEKPCAGGFYEGFA